eukprot:527059-Prorocentrum_minimum.AAC.2
MNKQKGETLVIRPSQKPFFSHGFGFTDYGTKKLAFQLDFDYHNHTCRVGSYIFGTVLTYSTEGRGGGRGRLQVQVVKRLQNPCVSSQTKKRHRFKSSLLLFEGNAAPQVIMVVRPCNGYRAGLSVVHVVGLVFAL